MSLNGELGLTLAWDRMAAAWASCADTAGPLSPPLWPKRNCKVRKHIDKVTLVIGHNS